MRDAKWITGVFNDRIDRSIIRYLFNEEPRAWFALLPPLDDTSSEDLQSLQTLVPMGLRVALKEVYKRFRWSVPGEGEQCLQAPQAPMQNGDEMRSADCGLRNDPKSESGNSERETQNSKLTQNAQTSDNTPIASGADPARNPGLLPPNSRASTRFNAAAVDNPLSSILNPQVTSRQMPDTQVDAGAFWSRVGLAPRGADGQTLPMPSLGYAVPNVSGTGVPACELLDSHRRDARATNELADRHASLVARGLGNSRAAQALQREINRRRQAESASLANDGFNPDEPRDKYGKWTTGSDAAGSKTISPPQTDMLAPEVAKPVGEQFAQNAYREAPAKLNVGVSDPSQSELKLLSATVSPTAKDEPPPQATIRALTTGEKITSDTVILGQTP